MDSSNPNNNNNNNSSSSYSNNNNNHRRSSLIPIGTHRIHCGNTLGLPAAEWKDDPPSHVARQDLQHGFGPPLDMSIDMEDFDRLLSELVDFGGNSTTTSLTAAARSSAAGDLHLDIVEESSSTAAIPSSSAAATSTSTQRPENDRYSVLPATTGSNVKRKTEALRKAVDNARRAVEGCPVSIDGSQDPQQQQQEQQQQQQQQTSIADQQNKHNTLGSNTSHAGREIWIAQQLYANHLQQQHNPLLQPHPNAPPPSSTTSAAATTTSSSTTLPRISAFPPSGSVKSCKRRKVCQACIPCRKSHMSCDDVRPCGRCVKKGQAHLCADEPRKKEKPKPCVTCPVTIRPKSIRAERRGEEFRLRPRALQVAGTPTSSSGGGETTPVFPNPLMQTPSTLSTPGDVLTSMQSSVSSTLAPTITTATSTPPSTAQIAFQPTLSASEQSYLKILQGLADPSAPLFNLSTLTHSGSASHHSDGPTYALPLDMQTLLQSYTAQPPLLAEQARTGGEVQANLGGLPSSLFVFGGMESTVPGSADGGVPQKMSDGMEVDQQSGESGGGLHHTSHHQDSHTTNVRQGSHTGDTDKPPVEPSTTTLPQSRNHHSHNEDRRSSEGITGTGSSVTPPMKSRLTQLSTSEIRELLGMSVEKPLGGGVNSESEGAVGDVSGGAVNGPQTPTPLEEKEMDGGCVRQAIQGEGQVRGMVGQQEEGRCERGLGGGSGGQQPQLQQQQGQQQQQQQGQQQQGQRELGRQQGHQIYANSPFNHTPPSQSRSLPSPSPRLNLPSPLQHHQNHVRAGAAQEAVAYAGGYWEQPRNQTALHQQNQPQPQPQPQSQHHEHQLPLQLDQHHHHEHQQQQQQPQQQPQQQQLTYTSSVHPSSTSISSELSALQSLWPSSLSVSASASASASQTQLYPPPQSKPVMTFTPEEEYWLYAAGDESIQLDPAAPTQSTYNTFEAVRQPKRRLSHVNSLVQGDPTLDTLLHHKRRLNLFKPWDYSTGYLRLHHALTHLSSSTRTHVLASIHKFQTRFATLAQSLTDTDLFHSEIVLEELKVRCDVLWAGSATPSALWRRTGEVVKCNRAFGELVGLDVGVVRAFEGRVALYDFLGEASWGSYFEEFVEHAFDEPSTNTINSNANAMNMGRRNSFDEWHTPSHLIPLFTTQNQNSNQNQNRTMKDCWTGELTLRHRRGLDGEREITVSYTVKVFREHGVAVGFLGTFVQVGGGEVDVPGWVWEMDRVVGKKVNIASGVVGKKTIGGVEGVETMMATMGGGGSVGGHAGVVYPTFQQQLSHPHQQPQHPHPHQQQHQHPQQQQQHQQVEESSRHTTGHRYTQSPSPFEPFTRPQHHLQTHQARQTHQTQQHQQHQTQHQNQQQQHQVLDSFSTTPYRRTSTSTNTSSNMSLGVGTPLNAHTPANTHAAANTRGLPGALSQHQQQQQHQQHQHTQSQTQSQSQATSHSHSHSHSQSFDTLFNHHQNQNQNSQTHMGSANTTMNSTTTSGTTGTTSGTGTTTTGTSGTTDVPFVPAVSHQQASVTGVRDGSGHQQSNVPNVSNATNVSNVSNGSNGPNTLENLNTLNTLNNLNLNLSSAALGRTLTPSDRDLVRRTLEGLLGIAS